MNWYGVGLGLLALCALACDKKSPTPPAPSAVPSAPSQAPQLKPAAPPGPVEAKNSCRALVVNGSVKSGPSQLLPQARVEQAGFVDVGAASRVVVKHTRSGRELTLEGPARARLCPEGEEQVLLASGRFKGTSGIGARPGAEVWVATPAGLIRYGEAELSVQADGKKVALSVVSGDAWVEPARGSTLKGKEHVVAKGTATLSRGAGSTAASLVSHCEETAEAAASAAQKVFAGPAGGADAGSFGERAAAQVRARRAARERKYALAGQRAPPARARGRHSDSSPTSTSRSASRRGSIAPTASGGWCRPKNPVQTPARSLDSRHPPWLLAAERPPRQLLIGARGIVGKCCSVDSFARAPLASPTNGKNGPRTQDSR